MTAYVSVLSALPGLLQAGMAGALLLVGAECATAKGKLAQFLLDEKSGKDRSQEIAQFFQNLLQGWVTPFYLYNSPYPICVYQFTALCDCLLDYQSAWLQNTFKGLLPSWLSGNASKKAALRNQVVLALASRDQGKIFAAIDAVLQAKGVVPFWDSSDAKLTVDLDPLSDALQVVIKSI